DVKITVLCCIFVPLAMLLAEYLKSTIVHLSKAARAQSSRVAERTYRDINQMVLQRVNGLEARWQESYFKELDKLEETSIKASILEGSLQPIYKVIAMLGIMAVLYLGGGKVIDGSWTVGSFTAYLAIFAALSGKASKTAKLFTSYQKAKVSWERIKQYLTPHQRTDQADHALTLPAKLTVHDLCFTYPESEEMKISHLSFQADSGQILGVTGPVASGKTTLGVALGGLYPYEGSIQLNGEELRELTPFQISRRIAVLSHRPQLLSDSIYHNITLGDGGDIATVLHHVCFDEDLKRMPQGIDTMVGSSGVRLSGGQQARIALARALYHETPLIILDDPFSAVDMKTERKIIANLKKYYQNSILVLISHRLAVFPDTDLVILLKTNRESEQGVHDELLETSSDYHTLYQLQMGEEAHEA
ncbi:MAG: ABC transporter ATP-binding protein, partial [Hungatella sp.]